MSKTSRRKGSVRSGGKPPLPPIEDLGVEHQRDRITGLAMVETTLTGEKFKYAVAGNGFEIRAREHQGGMVTAVGVTNTREHLIDALFQAGVLDSAATRTRRGTKPKRPEDDEVGALRYEAARRLRLIFDAAGLEPRACAAYEKRLGKGGGGGVDEMSDEQAEARSKLRKILGGAVDDGMGRVFRCAVFPYHTVLDRVVCWGEEIPGHQLDALRKGLDALVEWLGLVDRRERRPIQGGPMT